MSFFTIFDEAPVYHQAFEHGAVGLGASRTKKRRVDIDDSDAAIQGVAAILYHDNAPLQSHYMMKHHGVVLDRHDVRLLGPSSNSTMAAARASNGLREARRLNAERFKDLEYSLDQRRDDEEEEKAHDTRYARIPMNYVTSKKSTTATAAGASDRAAAGGGRGESAPKTSPKPAEAFVSQYELPEDAEFQLPKDDKQEAIIVKTAKFALQKPELRDKLMGETRLAFMKDGHPLNNFYQFIVDKLQNNSLQLRPTLRFIKEIEAKVDPLKMLALYGSSNSTSEGERVMKILVSYVEQYGRPFQAHVCQMIDPGDKRFAFLDPADPLNQQYLKLLGESVEEADEELKRKRQALAKLLMKTV